MRASVIIPCYNVDKHIENCIKSVLEQTYKNLELIVVDNNSSDGTFKKCLSLKDKYSFTLVQEQKQGACFARNTGLSLAKGEWIQFLDADDILKKDKIKNQVNFAKNHPQVDIIVGNYIYRFKNGEVFFIDANKDKWKGLFESRLGVTSANLFRKAILVELGGWNENLTSSHDYDLMFRILKNGGTVHYDNSYNIIKYEREFGQISKTYPERKWINHTALRKDIIYFLKKHNKDCFEKDRDWFYQKYFENLRILYSYNKQKAIELFNENIPKYFVPVPSNAISRTYILLFQFLGFAKTEEIRCMKKKLLLK